MEITKLYPIYLILSVIELDLLFSFDLRTFYVKSHYLISLLTADDSGCRLAAPESQLCGRDDRNYAADYLRGDGGWVATSETRPVEVENKLR